MTEVAEKAVVYASLILADEQLEVTADKLQSLIDAAGLEVEPIWSTLFAKALAGKNILEMLSNVGSASAVAAPVAAAGGAAGGAAAEEKKEDKKKKEEPEEEEDDDMGFGLFD